MKGNPEVVGVLQSALALEATIHLQYGTDARCLREVGLKKNAKKAAGFGIWSAQELRFLNQSWLAMPPKEPTLPRRRWIVQPSFT